MYIDVQVAWVVSYFFLLKKKNNLHNSKNEIFVTTIIITGTIISWEPEGYYYYTVKNQKGLMLSLVLEPSDSQLAIELQALFNNVSILTNLRCMSLHAIIVFDKV